MALIAGMLLHMEVTTRALGEKHDDRLGDKAHAQQHKADFLGDNPPPVLRQDTFVVRCRVRATKRPAFCGRKRVAEEKKQCGASNSQQCREKGQALRPGMIVYREPPLHFAII